MHLRLLSAALLAALCGWAQTPSGRWDGTIVFGALKVLFTMRFEGSGAALTGSFVNGESRVASTSGSFAYGTLRLVFEPAGTKLEA